MLQKEVVERICAKPGTKEYGRLSVMLQYYCDVESLLTISPEAFYYLEDPDENLQENLPSKKYNQYQRVKILVINSILDI